MEYQGRIDGRDEEVRALWKRCFPEDSEAYLDWMMTHKFAPERARGLVEDGKLVSVLHLLPLRLAVRGREMTFPFVSGAGTLPEYRGRGLMNRLLDSVFAQIREEGGCAVGLYPFSYGFYRRSGFESMGRCAEGRIAAEMILREGKRWPEPAGTMGRLTDAQMQQVYPMMAERFAVHVVRDKQWNESRLSEWKCDGGSAACYERAERAAGYALYAPLDGVLTAEELVYTDAEAQRALLFYLASVAVLLECPQVAVRLPEEEVPHALFSDSRNLLNQNPSAMLRIVDVERFFDSMETKSEGEFRLRIQDGRCSWNNGVFCFRCGGGRMEVRRCESGEADATVSIGLLTQLAAGVLESGKAQALGLLQTENRTFAQAFERCGALVLERY